MSNEEMEKVLERMEAEIQNLFNEIREIRANLRDRPEVSIGAETEQEDPKTEPDEGSREAVPPGSAVEQPEAQQESEKPRKEEMTVQADKEPVVTIIWSESKELREGQTMPFFRAKSLFDSMDKEAYAAHCNYKTGFCIDYVMDGKLCQYNNGLYNIGKEADLISNIKNYHSYYERNKKWGAPSRDDTMRSGYESELRDFFLKVLAPYLQQHCDLSDLEEKSLAAMENKTDMPSYEVDYHAAIFDYVSQCREKINNGDYGYYGDYELPPVPSLEDFLEQPEAQTETEQTEPPFEDPAIEEAEAGSKKAAGPEQAGLRPVDGQEKRSCFFIRMFDEERNFENTSGLDAEELITAYAQCERPFRDMEKYGREITQADCAAIEQSGNLEFSLKFDADMGEIVIFDGNDYDHRKMEETINRINGSELPEQSKITVAVESSEDYSDMKCGFFTWDFPGGGSLVKYRLITVGDSGELVPYPDEKTFFIYREYLDAYIKDNSEKMEVIGYDEMINRSFELQTKFARDFHTVPAGSGR